MRHFTFLHAIKVWPLEGDLAWRQGPEFSGMGECKRSHSRDRKTFPAFGNAKDFSSRDLKSPADFSGMGSEKKQQQGHHAVTFIM
jgi:hypothetical protein